MKKKYENWGYRYYFRSEKYAIKFCSLLAKSSSRLEFCKNVKNKKYLNPRSKIADDFPNNVTDDFPSSLRKSILQMEMIGEWKNVQELFINENIARMRRVSRAARTKVAGVARAALATTNDDMALNFTPSAIAKTKQPEGLVSAKNDIHTRKIFAQTQQQTQTQFLSDRRKRLLKNNRIRDNVNKQCFSVILLKDNIEISKDFANRKFENKHLKGDPESSFKGGNGEEAGILISNEISLKFSDEPYKLISNNLLFIGGDGGVDHYWHGHNVDMKFRLEKYIQLAIKDKCNKKDVIYMIFSGEDILDINYLDSFDAYIADLAAVVYNNEVYYGYDAVDFLIDCAIKDNKKC